MRVLTLPVRGTLTPPCSECGQPSAISLTFSRPIGPSGSGRAGTLCIPCGDELEGALARNRERRTAVPAPVVAAATSESPL